jgi:hypothetical protein
MTSSRAVRAGIGDGSQRPLGADEICVRVCALLI